MTTLNTILGNNYNLKKKTIVTIKTEKGIYFNFIYCELPIL